MERELLECKRCDWRWFPRMDKEDVKVCPNCKSPYWDREREDAKGESDAS